MRNQQRQSKVILYTILSLSILLIASSLIYIIYTNHQLTKQTNQIEHTASQTNNRINELESLIEDLSLQTDSDILETETKVETEVDTEVESQSTDDIVINNKPVEQKESQAVKETPAVAPKQTTETKPKQSKPSANDINTIPYTYTITSVDTLDDGSKGFEATSKDSGSMSFIGDQVENSSQLKVGDKVIAEFDNDGGLNRIYKK